MVDYYEILGAEPGCPQREIKKSFRNKAKTIHPDVASGNADADGRMRLLLKAYEVLGNPESRREYDRRYTGSVGTRFDYRFFLKSKPDDLTSQAKLIFFDLLHGWEDEAVDLFLRLAAEKDFLLENYLDSEDFMDCAFVLAEELERRSEYLQACVLLQRIVAYELRRPYFRHFFEEVIHRLRILACLKMPGAVRPEILLALLEDLVALELSGRDTAYFYKKMAEICSDLGRPDSAAVYLRRGLSLDNRLSGIAKLKIKIGYRD